MKSIDYGKFNSYTESENAIKIMSEIGKIIDNTAPNSAPSCRNAIQRIIAVYDLFAVEDNKKSKKEEEK